MAALAFYSSRTPSIFALFSIIFVQTVLKQFFEGSRETYSKALGETQGQRALQAELLHGLYSAQFLGPLLSIALIKATGTAIPLWFDAVTFIVAAIACLKLPSIPPSYRHSVLRPFSYLHKRPGLLQIFLIRSVGYWVPVGIFNYFLFSVILKHFEKDILDSAWSYSAIGLGSVTATSLLLSRTGGPTAKLREKIRGLGDAHIAFIALLALSITRVAFIEIPTLQIGLLVMFAGGICNGLNAVATQSLRRKLSATEQFPEVVGLELVLGRTTEWVVASLCLGALVTGHLTYSIGIWLSAALLFALAWAHLSPNLINQK